MVPVARRMSLVAAVATLGVGLFAAVASTAAQAVPTTGQAVVASTPNQSSTFNRLFGVSAYSLTDAWAVGDYYNNSTKVADTLIVHWNGTAWSRVPSLNAGTGPASLTV
jgi:hypothetical protein